jgi:hypothetical protein
MNIPVKSSSSTDIYYISVKSNNTNFDLECTCGLKFGIGKRKKCKHINYVINTILEEKTFNCKNEVKITDEINLLLVGIKNINIY